MSAPLKPWERAGINHQNANTQFTDQMSSPTMPQTLIPDSNRGVSTASTSRAPPALPPRPSQQRSTLGGYGMGGYGGGYNSFGGYNSPYSSMGFGGNGGMYGGGYSSYGGYGSGYGGYGSGYGGYGMNRMGSYGMEAGPTSFARQAEESSRQAFQSIESIVQAVGSVSMMLESSFSAVYNSFRAVIGVADHFSRMKLAFTQIFSALAIIRTLRWLCRKLLVLLRLRPNGYEEEVWAEAGASASALVDSDMKAQGRSSWPIMLFFGIIIGGPWLIWRLLSSLAGKSEGQEWHSGNDDHFRAIAEYDFQGDGDEELSFRRGQHITVAPKELQPKMRGWLLACVDGKKQGIIPANYVKILGKRRGRKHLGATSVGIRNDSRTVTAPDQVTPGGQTAQQYALPDITANTNNSSASFEATFNAEQELPSHSSTLRNTRESSEIDLGENMDTSTNSYLNLNYPLQGNPQLPRNNSEISGIADKDASDILEKSEGSG